MLIPGLIAGSVDAAIRAASASEILILTWQVVVDEINLGLFTVLARV